MGLVVTPRLSVDLTKRQHAPRQTRAFGILDRDRRVVLVVREIDEREPAVREQPQHAVVLELGSFGKRLVGLLRHLPYDTAAPCDPACSAAPSCLFFIRNRQK